MRLQNRRCSGNPVRGRQSGDCEHPSDRRDSPGTEALPPLLRDQTTAVDPDMLARIPHARSTSGTHSSSVRNWSVPEVHTNAMTLAYKPQDVTRCKLSAPSS